MWDECCSVMLPIPWPRSLHTGCLAVQIFSSGPCSVSSENQMAAANAKAKINLPCTSSTTFSALSPGSMLAFNVSGLYAFSLMSQISTYFASILPAQPCCSTYQLPGSKAAFNVRHRISTSRSFLAITKPIKSVPTAESSIQHHLCGNGKKGNNEFGIKLCDKRRILQHIAKRSVISDGFSCGTAFSGTPEIIVSFTLEAIKVGTEVQDFLRGMAGGVWGPTVISLSRTLWARSR